MTPQVGDILRVVLTFVLADGGLMQNIFTIVVTETVVSNWVDALSGVEEWLQDMYEAYMDSVATEVESVSSELQLRDSGAAEWNTVAQRPFTDIIGIATDDTAPSTTCGTVVAFPDIPRHWGFKNLPPVADSLILNGILLPSVVADMLLFAGFWTSGRQGLTFSFDSGVYSLATETFRQFTSSVKISDILGTRVTRKTGRGI